MMREQTMREMYQQQRYKRSQNGYRQARTGRHSGFRSNHFGGGFGHHFVFEESSDSDDYDDDDYHDG
eukprot:Pgem_evm1s12858